MGRYNNNQGQTMKTKRTRKWHKKLTLKELRHVLDSTTTGSLAQFKRNLDPQREQDRKNNDLLGFVPRACWECHFVAKKLGL